MVMKSVFGIGARRYKIPIKICYNDVDVDFDENVCTVDINFDQSLNDNLHFDVDADVDVP